MDTLALIKMQGLRRRPPQESCGPARALRQTGPGSLETRVIRGATLRHPSRFRVLHLSVQWDHVHLIVEASDQRALFEGVRSLAIGVARYVNQPVPRAGPRFHTALGPFIAVSPSDTWLARAG